MKLPEYIQQWHDKVRAEPKNYCKAIKDLVKLIEKLLKQSGVIYDHTDVEAFEKFCLLLRHKEGKWAGQPLVLTEEQKYIAACVLGIKIRNEDGRWVRYFREIFLMVARKWGKSTFIAALALYMLCADMEPAAQVWCLATVKEQAEIVFQNAVDFALSSPVLKKHVRRMKDTSGHRLVYLKNKSYMKAGSKNSDTKDGLNPHAVVIDELHAIKDRNTYDVMSSAMGAREQPLIIIITTAGFERESIFDQKYEQAKKVLKGEVKLRIFPMIFEIDKDDDPNDESCWIKANPGLGERPTLTYLREEYQKAKSDPEQWPSFLAKHLNRPSNASVIYFDLQAIDKCAIDMTIDMIKDKYAVGAADLAETTDLCAATALIPIGGKLYVFQKYFIAQQRIEQNSKADKMAYEHFTNTGAPDQLNNELLKICEGSMVSRYDVAEWFAELAEKYNVTFWKIGADRWHFKDFAEAMAMKGFPPEEKDGRGIVFEVPMGSKTLSEPMKETKALFEDGIIQYSRYNGLFRWCTSNTAAKISPANNEMQPDKSRSKARIDGYVSFLMSYIAYKKVKDLFDEYQP